MPIGIIVNAGMLALGGFLGSVLRDKLSGTFKEGLNMTLGCCAMTIGIGGIAEMENMPAVIFAVVVGTAIGLAIHLGEKINRSAGWMQKKTARLVGVGGGVQDASALLTPLVLFCASGTGLYGSLVSGMTGDHSILIAKSILDFFTAMIFACSLGKTVCLIAVPQFLIFIALFVLAIPISNAASPVMIHDFKAVGGIIMLSTGFRIAGIKLFPVADMLPAMVLAMPVSWFWSSFIQPVIAALVG